MGYSSGETAAKLPTHSIVCAFIQQAPICVQCGTRNQQFFLLTKVVKLCHVFITT